MAGGEEAGGAETDGNFDRFDINADGFLSQREIKTFMTEMQFHAKPDYLRDLIENFGVEVSGFLPVRFAHCPTAADRLTGCARQGQDYVDRPGFEALCAHLFPAGAGES